jgi:leucyl/phenylalanyl-tRNA--protein transferase
MHPSRITTADPWADFDPGDGIGVPAAIGGDVTPEFFVAAVRRGLICSPRSEPQEVRRNELTYGPDVRAGDIPVLPGNADPYSILWWSPNPRYIIHRDKVRIDRSLRRTLYRSGWTTTLDADLDGVLAGCRAHRQPRWITDQLIEVLRTLAPSGRVRSIEVWEGDQLAGGLFGYPVGNAFVMNSAFHARPDAAKAAIADLAYRVRSSGIRILDAQARSDYTVRMGAVGISRDEYLREIDVERQPLSLENGRLPVRRLLCPESSHHRVS